MKRLMVVQPCGENDRIAKRVYVGEYAGTHSLGRLWKRCIDMSRTLKKKKVFVSGKQGGDMCCIVWGMNP